jgi:dTDP-glucose 4,6-dehydratase
VLGKHCRLLVTGGMGFMGSAFIRYLLSDTDFAGTISNLDLLTYAANMRNLASIENDERYQFFHGNILDLGLIEKTYEQRPFDAIVHFAAETHVDRSIDHPQVFIETNVLGTSNLLTFVRHHPSVHFHHISTDEVYGSLGEQGIFTEDSPYLPNSPYAASKAASDHFVRAYAKTYGISVTLSHASNNYGPCQFPEKLIPLMISHALHEKPLPVYGKGENIRDWLFVEDHADAIWKILQRGTPGEIYNVGGTCEKRNIDLLFLILETLASKLGKDPSDYHHLITFVEDRPGHDFRYALDGEKMKTVIGWEPRHDLAAGLEKTIEWHLLSEQRCV